MFFRGRRAFGYAALPARLMAGGVLAVSGFIKLMAPAEELLAAVDSYRLLSFTAATFVARTLPWAELFIGACLLLGYGVRGAASLAAGLYGLFIAVLASALWRDLPLTGCGCFGRMGPTLTPAQALSLDIFLLTASVAVFADPHRLLSLDRWLDPPNNEDKA